MKILTLKSASEQLNVSVVSLHNWIKEGILKKTGNYLTQNDIDEFKEKYLKNIKLSSRANKQYKDLHDHEVLSEKIKRDLESDTSAEIISEIYESSLSESYKNKEGIYYTPQYIVEDMMKDINDFKEKTFLDPCCGSGNFIIEAIRKGFSPENIYGFDIDANAVFITKKRIKEISGYESDNIICADFLNQQTTDNGQQTLSIFKNIKFDYIFTNPPWGKKIKKVDKVRYSSLYNSGNSNDTSALFYFACLKMLKEDGKIGMLLPESFFNISTFEDARKSLLNLQIKRIIDYDKAFEGLITKAVAFVARGQQTTDNGQQMLNDNIISCEIYNVKKHLRSQRSFFDIPKHILNYYTDEASCEIIRDAFSRPYITLKDNAQWALGIITGNNARLCRKNPLPDDVPIYRGKDVFFDKLAQPSLFINKNLEECRQVADRKFYEAKDKIIYRFISNKIICYHDTEQRYILNSANLFILNDDFPLTYEQVCEQLNSEFMNWLFKSIFNTHKILRSDLEMLPLKIDN
ncbi:MAG: N-6 DNA methylase [Bacteroidales bacterium]|nr:N-6 DNA methylase [Bacteroidales bacterium]